MNCSFTVYRGYDGDGSKVYTRKWIKAKKDHRCSECEKVIKKGSLYKFERVLWEKQWETYKTCIVCENIREEFFNEGYYFSQIMSDLDEYISKCRGEIPSECLTRLMPEARNVVCDMIQRYWEETEDAI